MRTLFLVSLLGILACQPSAPAGAPTAGSAKGAGVVAVAIVPLKLTTTPEGEKQFHFKTLELKDDGALLLDGKPNGKILSDHLESADGKSTASFKADGTVEDGKGGSAMLGVDTLTNLKKKDILTVNNDGTVMLNHVGEDKKQLPASFEPFPPAGKHAALLALIATPIASSMLNGADAP